MYGINSTDTALIVFVCLAVAVTLGRQLRRVVPQHHLDADTRDTVKLAMGLIATMAALLLGLLVSSAKSAYDSAQSEVSQLVAKAVLVDRSLELYGPDAANVRTEFRSVVQDVFRQMWADTTRALPHAVADDRPGDIVYRAVQALAPRDDSQRGLKVQAVSLLVEMSELRARLLAEAAPSISRPLLIVVVAWLVVIFCSFSMIAPSNTTATFVLMIAAVSVAGAVFLILELDRPFSGLIQIPREPTLSLLNHLGN